MFDAEPRIARDHQHVNRPLVFRLRPRLREPEPGVRVTSDRPGCEDVRKFPPSQCGGGKSKTSEGPKVLQSGESEESEVRLGWFRSSPNETKKKLIQLRS